MSILVKITLVDLARIGWLSHQYPKEEKDFVKYCGGGEGFRQGKLRLPGKWDNNPSHSVTGQIRPGHRDPSWLSLVAS